MWQSSPVSAPLEGVRGPALHQYGRCGSVTVLPCEWPFRRGQGTSPTSVWGVWSGGDWAEGE